MPSRMCFPVVELLWHSSRILRGGKEVRLNDCLGGFSARIGLYTGKVSAGEVQLNWMLLDKMLIFTFPTKYHCFQQRKFD